VITGDLAMLTIGANILDKAWSNFRRVNLALAYFWKGSKSLLAIVTCMMEEHLLVLVLSSFKLLHTRLKAFNLLHETSFMSTLASLRGRKARSRSLRVHMSHLSHLTMTCLQSTMHCSRLSTCSMSSISLISNSTICS
jgi:hypothetical protein